jgi:beta-glucosidase
MSQAPIQQKPTVAYPFQDSTLSLDVRISDLINRMTLEEKIFCLSTAFAVPRLGVRGPHTVEGLHGLAQSGEAEWQPQGDKTSPTTTFPQSYGIGHTWNPELLKKAAAAQARECRYLFHNETNPKAGLIVLSPNADLGRDPRWGRTEECFGEDAFHVAAMSVAITQGLQGEDPNNWVCASLMKHVLANSHEVGREDTSSDFDDRLFREYYSVGFRKGIEEGGSRAYMACYNGVNGIPGCVHPMHRQIAIKEWNQDGIICTDGGALGLLITHHKYLPTEAKGARDCIKAGINIFLDNYESPVQECIKNGWITESDLDESLTRSFRVLGKLGLLNPNFNEQYADLATGPAPWLSSEHKSIAKQVTDESIVLLKNEGILPLNPAKTKKVHVVGRYADQVMFDWYSGKPPYAITPLEGIERTFDSVTYSKGDNLQETIKLASEADVVIAICGNHPTGNGGWAKVERPSEGKESVDRLSMTLEEETDFLKDVFQANPNTVLVLYASFPYTINWSNKNLPAILFQTHCSQETGNSLADALTGKVNPSGKLTQTWPQDIADLPDFRDYNIRNGRTYMYTSKPALFPFGFGLSYTSFQLNSPQVDLNSGNIFIKFSITNQGDSDGQEVVQIYARYLDSQVERPIKQLVGFQKISIKPQNTESAEITVPLQELAYWNVDQHKFIIEPGEIEIQIGTSSQSISSTHRITIATP